MISETDGEVRQDEGKKQKMKIEMTAKEEEVKLTYITTADQKMSQFSLNCNLPSVWLSLSFKQRDLDSSISAEAFDNKMMSARRSARPQ